MTAYATRADLYDYGLPRGTLGSGARLVASSLSGNETLELEEHGFETDDQVLVRATEGGTLSSPLAEGTTYYVLRLTASTFKLAATAGGAALNLTTDGVSMLVAKEPPIDRILERYSRFVDDCLPAHAVPLEAPYPENIIAIVCELAAAKLQSLSGTASEIVKAAELAAIAQLERYAKGIPLRDARATTSTNLAVTSALGVITDPRGWGSGELP